MEVAYEIELKYKRGGSKKDSLYSWSEKDTGFSCPKIQERADLVGLMLSDVSKLVSLGLRESDIFAHLEANLATPRVRFNIEGEVPIHIIGNLFKIDPKECVVTCDKKKNCSLQFKGIREV